MFDELWDRVIDLDEALSQGYDNRQEDLLYLIEDLEDALHETYGQVPPWEKYLLGTARSHVESNFLKAALNAVSTAMEVSQYSNEEYWGAYKYTNPRAQVVDRNIS
jgi:hypothetical protein